MEEDKKQDIKVLEVDKFRWILPECCQNNYDSCPHVVKKEKPKKQNIAL